MKFYSVIFAVSVFVTAQGVSLPSQVNTSSDFYCFNCENSNSNSDCNNNDALKCPSDEQACETEVRNVSNLTIVTKRCMEHYRCRYPNVPYCGGDGTCRYCCLTSRCNELQEPPSSAFPAGPPGRDGTPGIKGDQGRDGTPGAKGDKGSSGDLGPAGAVGPSGPPGHRGAKGDQGPVGTAGSPGQSGLPGPKGDQGLAGYSGLKGDPGNPGLRGSRGLKGEPGIPSQTGPAGARGDKGQCGSECESANDEPEGAQRDLSPGWQHYGNDIAYGPDTKIPIFQRHH